MTDEQLQKYVVGRESSKALKEIGFDEPCLDYWDKEGGFSQFSYYESERANADFNDIHPEYERESTAPLLDQVFEWFSDRFIFGSTFIQMIDSVEWAFAYRIQHLPKGKQAEKRKCLHFKELESYEGYELVRAGVWNTELEAKQECIKRMIQLFKEKQ